MINNAFLDSKEGRMNTMKQLCGWICYNYKYKDPLTHLKLQKLFFYCYGALLAKNLEIQIGDQLTFEPWEHGPVNSELYQYFRHKGANPISPSDFPMPGNYSQEVTNTLTDTITIYGAMSAWALRNQTHTETPWKTAYEKKASEIDSTELKIFFKKKFATGNIAAPEYLFGLSSFTIDGIPVKNYLNLHSLATAVNQVFSDFKKA